VNWLLAVGIGVILMAIVVWALSRVDQDMDRDRRGTWDDLP
jgi:hypothetical protein